MPAIGLRRELGLRDLVLLNVAAVVSLRWIAATAHVGPSSLVLWLAAVLLYFLPCALAVIELSTRFPAEGGYYVWTREAFGEGHAFVCGWMAWWSNLVFFPNLALALAGMAVYLWAGEHRLLILVLSLALFWLPTITNIIGLHVGKWTPNLGGTCTVLAGVVLVVSGSLAAWRQGPANPLAELPCWDLEKLNFWSQIALALVGIELSAILSAEVRNPQRDIPRAAIVSSFVIAAIFLTGTAALLLVLPAAEIDVVTGIIQGVERAGIILGFPSLGAWMTALVTLGLLGNLASWVAGAARLPFVIGLDRHLPAAFARLHPRFKTPHVALLMQGVLASVLLLAAQIGETARGAYLLLVDLTVFATMVPYLYLFAALLRLARDPGRGRAPKHILVPGGRAGVWLAGISGLATTLLAMILSLVPPPGVSNVWMFELKTLGGSLFALLVGAAFYKPRRVRTAVDRHGRVTLD